MKPVAHDARESTRASATSQPRRESLIRGLALTLGAQIIVAVCSLLLYRLIAMNTGTTGFASYSLVKQGVSLLFPVVTVGLVGGLPRYIALGHAQEGPPAESYLVSGTVISGSVTLLAVGIALVLPGPISRLLFGSTAHSNLVAPFAALLAATAVFYLAYGYYRGQLRLDRANGLQIVSAGVFPPLIVWALPDDGIGTLVALMAVALGGLSLAAVLVPLTRGFRRHVELMPAGKSLLNYGSRRVPGEIAQLTLVAIVPVVAAHVTTLRNVAFISAGMQVTVILLVALNPIGVVLLPALARNWVADREGTSRQVDRLSSFAVHLGLFALGQMALFAAFAVREWLGPHFAGATAIVRVIVLSVPLLAYYLTLRSSLDATAVRSYNSASNIGGLAAFAVSAALTLSLDLLDPAMALALSYTIGVTVRGLLTLFYVQRLFGLNLRTYRLETVVPLTLATVVLGLLARPVIEGSSVGLALLVGLESLLLFGFVAALFSLQVPWTRELLGRVPWIRRRYGA